MSSSRYFKPLRHRDFALLWSGQAISQLGGGVFTVTLAIEVLRIDQHAIALSYVLAARLLSRSIHTGGGVIVDRVPRRLAMLAPDIPRGAAVAAITVLVAIGEIHLIALVVMAFVFGVGDAVFSPAAMAIATELLPSELLVDASALSGTSIQVAGSLIDPAVGGLLVGFLGAAWGFGIDAASFIISAVRDERGLSADLLRRLAP
jgi:MFS family permease